MQKKQEQRKKKLNTSKLLMNREHSFRQFDTTDFNTDKRTNKRGFYTPHMSRLLTTQPTTKKKHIRCLVLK